MLLVWTLKAQKKAVLDSKFNVKVVGNGKNVIDQIPKAGFMLKEGSTIVLFTVQNNESEVVVPNVVGLSMQDAQKVLTSNMLNIKIKGIKGKAIRQDPQPGTKVPIGSIVEVEFADKENAE